MFSSHTPVDCHPQECMHPTLDTNALDHHKPEACLWLSIIDAKSRRRKTLPQTPSRLQQLVIDVPRSDGVFVKKKMCITISCPLDQI